MQDIGPKLLQSVGFASPDDASIQAAIEANDAFVGRLEAIRDDVKRQFTILASSPHRVASRYDELSADTPLNQILKAAVTRLRVISRASENQRRLNELEFALADVTRVPVEQLAWRQVVLDRTNRVPRPAAACDGAPTRPFPVHRRRRGSRVQLAVRDEQIVREIHRPHSAECNEG